MTTLLVAVLMVLGCSAIASGSEAALFAVPYGRVLSAVEKGRRGAASLMTVKRDMARPIMAIVVFNNIANIAGSMVVGTLAGQLFDSFAVSVLSAVLTFAVIIFSEIIPKTLGERHADTIALLIAPPLLLLTRLSRPALWAIERLVQPFVGDSEVVVTSEDEIRALTHAGEQAGIIEQDESELIQRVFRLNDTTARDIMTSVNKTVMLEGTSSIDEVRDQLGTFSRMPVYEGSIDNVTGVAYSRDLLNALVDGREANVTALARDANYVPATLEADSLLKHFQQTKQHLAIVIDEGGTVLGVVTLEDVIEELVGEIVDETDVEVPSPVRRIGPDEVVVEATAEWRDVNEALEVDVEEGRIGERVTEILGRIPNPGEQLEIGPVVCEVLEATPRAIKSLRIRRS